MTHVAQSAASPTVADNRCPICERPIKNPHRAKKLFGISVCNRCRNGFANRRQLAYLIDAIIWFFGVGFLYEGITYLIERPPIAPGAPTTIQSALISAFGFDSVFGFVWVWMLPLVFFCKDGFSGMSPGKWVTGVQVVDAPTREPIRFAKSFKRNLVLMIPFAVLVLAVAMMKGRRPGDRWANTEVIWRKYAFRPPFDTTGRLCAHCGYDLTGNVSGKCPECFTPVPVASLTEAIGTA
jgi:hypothetical protein